MARKYRKTDQIKKVYDFCFTKMDQGDNRQFMLVRSPENVDLENNSLSFAQLDLNYDFSVFIKFIN